MEMPDVIYVETDQREYFFEEEDSDMKWWNTEKYHHSRIVEALKTENEQLKAKLEKAKRVAEEDRQRRLRQHIRTCSDGELREFIIELMEKVSEND